MPLLFDQDTDFVDPNKNYLEEYVGEGKKFQTPEQLARAKAESDAHIARLQKELADQRDLLKEQVTMNQFLQTLKETGNPPSNGNNQPPTNNEQVPNPSLKPEELDALLENKLTQRDAKRRAEDNFNQVEQALIEAWGKDYRFELTKRAQENNLERTFLENLASTNPKAFLKLLDVQPVRQPTSTGLFGAPPSQNTTISNPGKVGVKNYKYYQELRKKDPLLYSKVHIQNEMYKEASRQGPAFYD